MKPVLYSPAETDFTHNGLGVLIDAISAVVTEERNGSYELEMRYPLTGIHYAEIKSRSLIKAKPNQKDDPQLFRVYSQSRPMNGIVTIRAAHISYDLAGVPVQPFSADGISSAMVAIKQNTVVPCSFEFSTDKSSPERFTVSAPASIRACMGGTAGSLLDTYGGEFYYDNFMVKLLSARGNDNGVIIKYGKNLTDIKQDENCTNVFTGIYPYWQDYESRDIVEVPGKIVKAEGEFGFEKIKPVDLSGSFENKPTPEALLSEAQRYVKQNRIGIPKVSLKVSFVQLDQTQEYKDLGILERVNLCDTVHVDFPALGVSTTAKVNKLVYDVLLDRVESVSLGDTVRTISDTVAEQRQELEKKPDRSVIAKAIDSVTATILGADGGAVRLLDTNGDGQPDTLYIADDPDPLQARKVWRFNYEGWGASTNGYNGPFTMGATLDDGLLAEFVTAANLTAGSIRSESGNFQINLSDGILQTVAEATYYQKDYTQADVDRVADILLGKITPTPADYEKYDFYRDGRITATDLVKTQELLLKRGDLTVQWVVKINPNDRHQMLDVYMVQNGSRITSFFASLDGIYVNAREDPEAKSLLYATADGKICRSSEKTGKHTYAIKDSVNCPAGKTTELCWLSLDAGVYVVTASHEFRTSSDALCVSYISAVKSDSGSSVNDSFGAVQRYTGTGGGGVSLASVLVVGGRASVSLYAYNSKGDDAIKCKLNAVKIL